MEMNSGLSKNMDCKKLLGILTIVLAPFPVSLASSIIRLGSHSQQTPKIAYFLSVKSTQDQAGVGRVDNGPAAPCRRSVDNKVVGARW